MSHQDKKIFFYGFGLVSVFSGTFRCTLTADRIRLIITIMSAKHALRHLAKERQGYECFLHCEFEERHRCNEQMKEKVKQINKHSVFLSYALSKVLSFSSNDQPIIKESVHHHAAASIERRLSYMKIFFLAILPLCSFLRLTHAWKTNRITTGSICSHACTTQSIKYSRPDAKGVVAEHRK